MIGVVPFVVARAELTRVATSNQANGRPKESRRARIWASKHFETPWKSTGIASKSQAQVRQNSLSHDDNALDKRRQDSMVKDT